MSEFVTASESKVVTAHEIFNNIVVTGFYEPQPRRYMIMELTDQVLQNVARGSRIDLSYFD